MRRWIFILFLSGALLASACGGGKGKASPTTVLATPAATSTPRAPAGADELRSHEPELRESVASFQKGIFKQGAVKSYGYLSADFKKKCALQDFVGLLAIVKVFLGDLTDADIQVDVTGVRYEDGKAFVSATGKVNGEEVSNGSEEFPEYWVRENGEWKVMTDDPSPCDTNTAFGNGSSPNDKTPAATGPGTTRAEAVAIGTTVRTVDAEVTVLSVNLDARDVIARASSFPSTPEAGNRYVLVRLRAKAVGSGEETINVADSNFSMTGSGNKVYEPYGDGTSCGFDVPDELNAKLFPGGEAEGNVCIQLPRSERGLILIFEPQFSFNNKGRRYLALE